jgi:ATP-binding cassette subfamily B (MDR/TAP) protein 1
LLLLRCRSNSYVDKKEKEEKIVEKEMGGEGDGHGGGGGGGAREAAKADKQKVSFLKLFSFADRIDVILIVVGTISAMANGVSQPLMTVIFGKLINSFGSSDPSQAINQVSKVVFLQCSA